MSHANNSQDGSRENVDLHVLSVGLLLMSLSMIFRDIYTGETEERKRGRWRDFFFIKLFKEIG